MRAAWASPSPIDAGGVGLGRGDHGGALAVGGASDHASLALSLGPRRRGDPLALAADLLENGRTDLLGIIQPPQPHGDDLQTILPRGLLGHAPVTSVIIASRAD